MKRKYKKHTNPNCSCVSCKSKRGEMKGKNSPNFKNKKLKCIDCGELITSGSKKGRCHSCAQLGSRNPNFKNGKT